ncbi:MAG: ATP-grasp domain-containing protein [Fervidobacterium sp.]
MSDTVMVIGFNIRPVACLCKQLGFRVIAIDYWGDLDIKNCADFLVDVFHQKQSDHFCSDFNKPCSELLVDLAEKVANQVDKINFILVGSGFDDRPDLWMKLRHIAPTLGNSPERLNFIRDHEKLFSVAAEVGINFPRTEKAKSPSEAVEIAKDIGFPVVLKPIKGSGGFRIRFGMNPQEIEKNFEKVAGDNGGVLVQEYIRGINASSSILGDGNDCVVVSINEQLIGVKKLGCTTPFGYCGNVVPLKLDNKILRRVEQISLTLGTRLKLVGTNGFDFVIRPDGEPFLMEVNPRFQGTLELVKYVTGLNLVEWHIKACYGELPKEIPPYRGYAAKMIIFAKRKSIIPDLSGINHLFDVPNPGTIVNKGNPICTVQVFSDTRKKAIEKAFKIVSKVKKTIKNSS